MPSIVDAIKEKHPEATGNTIAEVIRTSESGGGDNSPLIVRLTQTGDKTYTADILFADLKAAFDAGRKVEVAMPRLGGIVYLPFSHYLPIPGNETYIFDMVFGSNDQLDTIHSFTIGIWKSESDGVLVGFTEAYRNFN